MAGRRTSAGTDSPRIEATQWTVVPPPREIEAIAKRCRRMASKRALVAAGVAMVPVPGLDWATDVGILAKLLPDIDRAFGLTPAQVERLAPHRRMVVYKALSAGSSLLVGRLVTRELIMGMLKVIGVRLTAQQAAKFVPIAGQAVSAALTFSALKYVCDLHIKQCVAICEQINAIPAQSLQADEPGTTEPPSRPAIKALTHRRRERGA